MNAPASLNSELEVEGPGKTSQEREGDDDDTHLMVTSTGKLSAPDETVVVKKEKTPEVSKVSVESALHKETVDEVESAPHKETVDEVETDESEEVETDAVEDCDVDIDEADESECPQEEEATSATKAPLALPSPEDEKDEEIRLAMEMAIAAAQNPHLSPAEIQKLVGEKNKQQNIVAEVAKKQEEKLKREQEREEAAQRAMNTNKKEGQNGWWAAAAKKAEAMKDSAQRRIYADQIKKDKEIIEVRKTMKILRKTLKAHRLQGNRVETRHAFKRQRMEKKMIQTAYKLDKTQKLFTNTSYNVQEYLKAMMRASKKWRKKGSDEELMLEAQLCRNMHQMLALEKQKVKCKKNTKEMKKYLQRCKGWLSDKKAFCEMNFMTLDATQNSMVLLYEDTLKRQDALITKLKATAEFKNVDLSEVDVSHIDLPTFAASEAKDPDRSAAMNAMRGLPITDSIRVKKDHIERDEKSHDGAAQAKEEAQSRQELIKRYHEEQARRQQQAPELYVVANDDVSVSSHLSDPDGSMNDSGKMNFGSDAPWMRSSSSRAAPSEEDAQKETLKPKSRKPDADANSTDSESASIEKKEAPVLTE